MPEKNDSLPTNIQQLDDPEYLRVIYNARLAYINTVVTFRFTTLSFFFAGVAIILQGTPSIGKYLLLTLVTIALYLIEIRNRFLKNRLEVETLQIQKKWGYVVENKKNDKPENTTILGFLIKNREDDYTKSRITHSFAIDILYFSIFLYALIQVLILFIPIIKSFTI